MRQDLRFALRTFAKRPGFTTVAILTLALGIGAATAVFSIVDAVLLRPLPYKDPDRLVAVWIGSTREKELAKLFAIHQDYVEFQRHSLTLESVSAATWAKQPSRVMTGQGPARDVLTIPASVSFFELLGVQAALGRTFVASDRGCSVILSNAFWASAFGADPAITGKSIVLDQKPCTIVGVMPRSFSFYPRATQAWMLLGPDFATDQDQMQVGIFARLKPGVTKAQAETELRSLFRAIHPGPESRDFQSVVYPLHGEFTYLAGRTLRATLMTVFGAVLLVLLIACLNVANLLAARLSERQGELAVRAALGSGQSRLLRQVLTECLLLSAAGAALGIAIAYAALRLFRYYSPVELSVGAELSINLPVLLFCASLAIATTLISGLVPALRASRVDLAQRLQHAGRGAVRGRHGIARMVIAAEMALSFLLLICAGLLMTSALRMGSEHLGFDPEHVIAGRVALPAARYSNAGQRMRFYDELLRRLERLPGAAGAALASKLPPEAGGNQTLEIQGRPVASGTEIHDVGADAVSPALFDVLKIPVYRGRAFDARDQENSLPVTIVNEALAREYFPDRDPIGQQIRIPGGMQWLTIVGVAGNLKHTMLINEMNWFETPILYRPLAQEPRPSIQIAVRAAAGPGSIGKEMSLGKEIQKQIAALDPLIPVTETEALSSRLSRTLAYPRFRALVLGLFALSALLLSAVGLHGVLSQLVVQRTPEFGVRKAVGAGTFDLLALVARQGGMPVLGGLAVGIGATLAFSHVLSNMLYGIAPADPKMLAAVSLTLLIVAALAMLVPASRAARVDPMRALRD